MSLSALLHRAVRARIHGQLADANVGQLQVTWPDKSQSEHGAGEPDPVQGELLAAVQLNNHAPLRQLLLRGQLGFAESHMRGDWHSDDLSTFFHWIQANEQRLSETIGGAGGHVQRWLNRLRHRRNGNSKQGSRRNIAFHYDLGNDFYRLWLDDTMTYSSALFDGQSESLKSAQLRKMDNAIDALDVRNESDSVLEIGCGWGGMAERIGQRSGARVRGLTLSREQHAYAQQRMGDDQPEHEFVLQDYRDEQGVYDRVVSIEMFEAVGERYWDVWFRQLAERLKPGGAALVQTITIDEAAFERYRSEPDFIQRYIFPGGMLPSKERFRQLAARHGFSGAGECWFGASYAETLRRWRERFEQALPAVEALGYPADFQRLWRYYLSYCEVGFDTARTDVGQILLHKRG